MLKKLLLSVFFVLLIITPAWPNKQLTDLSYRQILEVNGTTIETMVYMHKGITYQEIAGELWVIETNIDTLAEEKSLEESVSLQSTLLSETLLDGKKVEHTQVINTKTNHIMAEFWREINSNMFYKIIFYNFITGEATSTIWITDVNENPDLSHIDFSKAQTFPTAPSMEPANEGQGLLRKNPELDYRRK